MRTSPFFSYSHLTQTFPEETASAADLFLAKFENFLLKMCIDFFFQASDHTSVAKITFLDLRVARGRKMSTFFPQRDLSPPSVLADLSGDA